MIEWILLSSLGIILLIIIWKLSPLNILSHYYRWRSKYRYSPKLPNVIQYGGTGNLQSAILTTEYPHDKIVNTVHLADSNFPYHLRNPFLSTEKSVLFQALIKAFYQQPYYIFMNIPLTELLIIDNQAKNQQVIAERLQQKYVDFVLYHTVTLKIIGVIMLTNSHEQKLNDHFYQKFIKNALLAAKVPILQLPIKKQYNIMILRQILNKKFNLQLSTAGNSK